MNENIIPPTEEPESGEARGAEQQSLDDATYEPRAAVEQSGDYRQAEAIQAALTEVVQSASAGGEKPGATPQPIPRPEDQGLAESQSQVRGDLDQATAGSKGSGKDEATPINLPDMQETNDKGATPQPIPRPEDQGLAESQSQVRGPQRLGEAPEPGPHPFPNVAHEEGDSQVGGPQEPIQQAHFEKPILQEGMEDLNPDLSNLDDLDSVMPGPGKIGGKPGSDSPDIFGGHGGMPGGSWLNDVPGGKDIPGGKGPGFGGGPSDLNNDPMGSSGEGYIHPATGTIFAPGKGPDAGKEMEGGGKKGGKKDDSSESGGKKDSGGGKDSKKGSGSDQGGKDSSQKYPVFVVESDKAPKDAGTAFYDSKTGDFYYSTVQGVLRRSADLINMEVANILDGKGGGKTSSETTTTEEGGGSARRETPNPKYDQEQISLHTADDLGNNPTGDGVLPKYQKKMKDIFKRANESKGKKMKAGSEVVTDPPEHEPQPKSKTGKTGKGS